MGKLYIVSGKICSGKSYYSKQLKDNINAVVLSPDDATYKLINNEQGEFYNVFSNRLLDYLNELAVEIIKAGANVIYERGLWTKKDRQDVREYFKNKGIDVEIHYIHISDELWKKQIQERNKRVLEGNGGSDFYLDDGLMNKLLSKFEEPTKDEVDVWYENKYRD